MLLNQHGQQVQIDKRFNSVDNPLMFCHLREKLEPATHKHNKMFRLDQRAKMK